MQPTTADPGMIHNTHTKATKLHRQRHERNEAERASTKRALLERLQDQYGPKFAQMKNSSMGTLWREFVHNRNDAEAFMEVMYPQFQEPIRRAYVDMFERAISGQITLDEKLLFKKGDKEAQWDPIKEIEKAKMDGLINLTHHRLSKLLEDEEVAETRKS